MPQVGEEHGHTGALAGSSGRGCQRGKARAPSLTHDLQELKGLLCAKCLLRAWCVMALCDPVRCRSRPALQQSAGL